MAAATETTPAILLRRTLLRDTSLIVTWLTPSGLLKTVARGARAPKSSFAGRLDLFYETEIAWAHSKRSELQQLREVMVKNPHDGLRRSYARVEVAAHFVELLELTGVPEHPAGEQWELMRRALSWLDENEPTKKGLLHFERELARSLGVLDERQPDPATAIFRLSGRLPEGRAALLRRLA